MIIISDQEAHWYALIFFGIFIFLSSDLPASNLLVLILILCSLIIIAPQLWLLEIWLIYCNGCEKFSSKRTLFISLDCVLCIRIKLVPAYCPCLFFYVLSLFFSFILFKFELLMPLITTKWKFTFPCKELCTKGMLNLVQFIIGVNSSYNANASWCCPNWLGFWVVTKMALQYRWFCLLNMTKIVHCQSSWKHQTICY